MIILNRNGTPRSTWEQHARDSSLQKLYQDQQGGRRHLVNLPVCPKCESVGLRDKGWNTQKTMACPRCGYRGQSTYIFRTYVRDQLYK